MEIPAMSYQDENGIWWVMCACGHYAGGSCRPGDKIALCVNCRFLGGKFVDGKRTIDIFYPDLLPPSGMMELQGDHPDHIASRAKKAKRDARNKRVRERRQEKRRIHIHDL